MRSTQHRLFAALILLVAAATAFRPVRATDPPAAGEKTCACKSGFGACQHWLGIPGGVTIDPCYCDRCREELPHTGKDVPEGMNPLCFASPRMACYLKRHSAAWHLACSECLKNEKCCPIEHAADCPYCGNEPKNVFEKDEMGRPAKETVLARLAAESKLADAEHLVVVYNRHFYLVTNVRDVKVKMRGGSYRVFNTHEYAHLMLERAEMARKEFVEAFGERFALKTPVAIFLPQRESEAAVFQNAYMGSPKTNQLYGGTDSKAFVGGMCCNGFCCSAQKYRPDDGLHFVMRHMIGHALIGIWVVADGNNRTLPRWLFEGVGHWLSRNQERFKDDATYCADEGTPINGSGKDWMKECQRIASSPRTDTIEKLFGKTAIGQLNLEDDQRSWCYLELCLKEWREPFVAMLADLRQGKEVRDSFMKHLQCTPEIFDERWRKRVLLRRHSMSPKEDEEGKGVAENASPTARERRGLHNETDLPTLAAKIRALGTIDDPDTVNAVLDLFARPSELVRESAMVALLKMKAEPCIDRIASYGLVHENNFVRAYAARLCGKMVIQSARPNLRTIVAGDKYWLARAEGAIACGVLQDGPAYDSICKIVSADPAEKAQLAGMDALALYRERAASAVPTIAAHLTAAQWQLRVASCQSLAGVGSMDAVEPMIARMQIETGHVKEEIREALKTLCRVDMGMISTDWKKWWERAKETAPGGKPQRPKEVEVKPDPRYAPPPGPTYYGIQIFSSKVGFVLDTSGSMDQTFEPDPKISKQLSREYHGTSKLEICKEEIAQTLSKLDPRAHFSIIVFNTQVRTFNKDPVPAAPSTIAAATTWLRALPPAGETNYYGGLRAALNLDEGPELAPNFHDTPDTLTFLTDGSPTQGEITDADTLLEWYTSLNRYARIRTHVIAFGTKGVDIHCLQKMAERNGGKFVHVPEKGD